MLNKDDKELIVRALSYYAQMHFSKGVYKNEQGMVDVKEECYRIVAHCDVVIDKINKGGNNQ